MPLRAFGFCRPMLSCIAAPNILGVGDRFEMCRVVAVPNPAEMVELKTLGDRSDHLLADDSMHLLHLGAQMDTAVSGVIGIASPKPAASSDHSITQLDIIYT